MADAFAPTADFSVAAEQPTGGVENRAAEVAIRGVSGLFESLARTKSAGASQNLDPLRKDFLNQLNKIEAQRAQGFGTKADLNWERLRNNYAMAGGDYQDGFDKVIESVTGRSFEYDVIDPTQRQLEAIVETDQYRSAFLAATYANPEGSPEEWQSAALSSVAELEHAAQVISEVQSGNKLSWETQVRGSYQSVVNNFKQGTLAGLLQITEAGAKITPEEVAQAKLTWQQLKTGVLSDPAYAAEIERDFGVQFENIDDLFESMTKIASSELAVENLKSILVNSMISGDGTQMTAEEALGVLAFDRDPNAYLSLTKVNQQDLFASLSGRTEAGMANEAEARLSDTLTQNTPANASGVVDNQTVDEIPEEFSGYADMSKGELRDNLLGSMAHMNAVGVQAVNAGNGANEDLRDSMMSVGSALVHTKEFVSASLMSQIFGSPESINQKLDALAGIDAKDAREARVMLRSGLNSQIRMLKEAEQSVMSELHLQYDSESGAYFIPTSDEDAIRVADHWYDGEMRDKGFYINPKQTTGPQKWSDLMDRRKALNVAERAFESLKVEEPDEDDNFVPREAIESAVKEVLYDSSVANQALLALQQGAAPLTGPVSNAQQRDVEPVGQPVAPPPEVESGEIPGEGPEVTTSIDTPELTGRSEISDLVETAGVQADMIRSGDQDEFDSVSDKVRSRQRVQELLTPQQLDVVSNTGYSPEDIAYFPNEESAEEALAKGDIPPNTIYVTDDGSVFLLEEAKDAPKVEGVPEVAIPHLKQWEGLRLEAYQDQAGIWTIGYGHTSGVKQGDKITEEEALRLFEEDSKEAVRALDRGVEVQLNDNQRAALISFVFNVGAGAFADSTLLRKLNSGDFEGAAKEFQRWKYVTDPKTGEKVVSQGLLNRRRSEESLFLGG